MLPVQIPRASSKATAGAMLAWTAGMQHFIHTNPRQINYICMSSSSRM